jgi:hypothetical protein
MIGDGQKRSAGMLAARQAPAGPRPASRACPGPGAQSCAPGQRPLAAPRAWRAHDQGAPAENGELGKGNSHTLDNIPFVLVGGGLDFRMGRSLRFRKVPHNRLLLSLAQGMGHTIERFGNPDFCGDGPLTGLA